MLTIPTCSIAGVTEIRPKVPGLVRALPLDRGAVVVVGVDVVIVYIHPS